MNEFLATLAHEFEAPFQNLVLVFSLILFIILFSPLLLRRLRIPGVIVLIISGIIIGPHGFNLIEKNSAINLFSTIGLLYIMFLSGLELDLREYRNNRNKSLLFGFMTFAIPLALGYVVCAHVLGYGFWTSLLVASMMSTHTLVAYPIVSRLGVARNPAVAITVGGTILTDTAVLILLAVISSSSHEGFQASVLLRLSISFILYLLFMVFIVTRVSRWFFKRLENESYSQFIYVLSVVFLSAFLAELAGLEPIIGAFAAGFTLNRLIPHTSPLMNRIEFAGNSLFIPFFLISVGMLVDVRVIIDSFDTLTIAGTLIVVALFSKWLAAATTAFIFKYRPYQRKLIYGLSVSHSAAILAVVIVGREIGLIDDYIQNAAILIILISCFVASFVTDRAAKLALLEENQTPADKSQQPERIIIPLANPASSSRLIDLARALNHPKNPHPLMGFSVVEDDQEVQTKLIAARKMLDQAKVYAAGSGQRLDVVATIDQNIVAGIKRIAQEYSASDIVLGTPGRSNVADHIFGRIIEQIISSNHQTIFLIHSTNPLNLFRRVHLACPRYCEREYGFNLWLEKFSRLCSVLDLKIVVHSPQETWSALQKKLTALKMLGQTSWIKYDSFDDLEPLANAVHKEDLIAVVRPRRGSLSYDSALDHIGFALMRMNAEISFLLMYPAIPIDKDYLYVPEEFDSSAISQGLKELRKRLKV
jgi:Kef-type K+ transport system membrane component KefB/nucleotide-binding universal stress UspA family protein